MLNTDNANKKIIENLLISPIKCLSNLKELGIMPYDNFFVSINDESSLSINCSYPLLLWTLLSKNNNEIRLLFNDILEAHNILVKNSNSEPSLFSTLLDMACIYNKLFPYNEKNINAVLKIFKEKDISCNILAELKRNNMTILLHRNIVLSLIEEGFINRDLLKNPENLIEIVKNGHTMIVEDLFNNGLIFSKDKLFNMIMACFYQIELEMFDSAFNYNSLAQISHTISIDKDELKDKEDEFSLNKIKRNLMVDKIRYIINNFDIEEEFIYHDLRAKFNTFREDGSRVMTATNNIANIMEQDFRGKNDFYSLLNLIEKRKINNKINKIELTLEENQNIKKRI